MRKPILILGGGLAGAAAAISLARSGVPVVLVEREAAARNKVCGEFLSEEALQLLAGLGVHPERAGAPAIGTVRLAAKGHVAEAALPFEARSWTRCCLDGVLLRAAEEARAAVRRGVAVEGLERDGEGGWTARLSTGEALRAPRVVVASGKHDLRGYPRPRGVQGELVAMKMYFQLRAAQTAALRGAVELLLHPEGYTGLQMVEGERANLTALVHRRHLARLGGWSGLLEAIRQGSDLARERLEGAEPLLDKPLALSAIPYGYVRRQAMAEGMWAVGDQAAVIPSFTGDGMSMALYTGLRAAKGLLEGERAEVFQDEVYRTLHGQVARATWMSRALLYRPARALLMQGARVWPRGLGEAARWTRLPGAALRAVEAGLH